MGVDVFSYSKLYAFITASHPKLLLKHSERAVAEWQHVGLVVKRSGVRSPAVLPNL